MTDRLLEVVTQCLAIYIANNYYYYFSAPAAGPPVQVVFWAIKSGSQEVVNLFWRKQLEKRHPTHIAQIEGM